MDTDGVQGCEAAQVAMLYVRGLIYAEEAFKQGGPPESLAPVRQAMASLEAIAKGRPGSAAIARLVLQAAAAAAQSERDEMSLYLESAVQMESLQRAGGQPGAPLVSAAEAAGDLWLQLHGYDAARRAFLDAEKRVGSTARVLAGVARSAERLGDVPAACCGVPAAARFVGRYAPPPRCRLPKPVRMSPAARRRIPDRASQPAWTTVTGPMCWSSSRRTDVKPTQSTSPESVREFLNDLYRYELRRLRDRLIRREIAKPDYYAHVVEVRARYRLLSLKQWTEE